MLPCFWAVRSITVLVIMTSLFESGDKSLKIKNKIRIEVTQIGSG